MVLLTSSAVSIAISSTVICIFTFLLFLSGYVLQQQTVRSLQEALHRPPEPKPSVILPQKFWLSEEDELDVVLKDSGNGLQLVQVDTRITQAGTQEVLGTDATERPEHPVEESRETPVVSPTEASSDVAVSTILEPAPSATPEQRLAYILALSSPNQICSALLFFKWQREMGLQTPSLNLLYPSIWEVADSTYPAYKTALDLMRDAEDAKNVILHPVEISAVWEGITIENQLLAGLQRNWMRWGFDRSIYLRSPGLALDITQLDSALSKSSLKKSWTPLSSAPQIEPDVLLMSAERNMIMVPRGAMRGLTVHANMGNHEQRHSKEMEIEARLVNKKAGYVVFDEKELEHRRGEKEWYGGVFERFEKGQKEVCAGTPFVKHEGDSNDKFSVRRGRGM
jgi:hypothetical protein